jgi:pimeloyl-ACP methyl ester carboxylesterase
MQSATVLYVHGLWMTGFESGLLRRRLARERGYRVQVFRYHSLRGPMREHAAGLREAISALDSACIHLVGHSLGGLVILRCLERYPMTQPGRVVLIAPPAGGSQSARHLGRWGWGRRILGAAAGEELLVAQRRHWAVGRELGIIAGTSSVGLAKLLVTFGEENDGVVAVSETRLPGAKEYLHLPASHSGLLLSARVARETGSFLEYGIFGR